MSTGIIYFSRNNSTQITAEIVKNLLGGSASLIQLKEKTGRDGIFGFMKSGFQAVTNRASQLIGDPWQEAAKHKTLYLMTPIWGGHKTPAMNAFLRKMDFSFKTVYLITVQADPDHRKSDMVHQQIRDLIKEKGGMVIQSIALTGAKPGKTALERDLKSQLDGIPLG